MEEIAKLKAVIGADISEFQEKIGTVGKGINGVLGGLNTLGNALAGIGVVGFLGKSISEASASQRAIAQLDAVIKSTAGANADAVKQTGRWITTTRMSAGAAAAARDKLGDLTAKIHDMEYSLSKSKHPSEVQQRKLAELRAEADKLSGSLSSAGEKVRTFIDPSKGLVPRSTREELLKLASDLQKVTMYSDETVIGVESMLMTFTKVGKSVMPQATEAVLDMATAMGTDTKSAAVMLGKALQDPINGITALKRVGVTFTAEQERAIRKMVRMGDIAGAQKIILAELETEFGNSARAAGDTFAGKLAILQNSMSDLMESIGNALLPILTSLADWFAKLVQGVGELDPGIVQIAAGFVGIVAAASPIAGVLGTILSPIGAIGIAAAGLYALWDQNIGGLKDITSQVMTTLQPSLDQITKGIQAVINAFDDTSMTQGVQAGFGGDMFGAVQTSSGASFGKKLGEAMKVGLPDILKGLSDLALGVIKAIPDVFVGISKAIATVVIDAINGAFGTSFNLEKGLARAGGAVSDVGTIFDLVVKSAGDSFENLKTTVGQKLNDVKVSIEGVWNSIFGDAGTVRTSVTSASNWIGTTLNNAGGAIMTGFNGLKLLIEGVWNGIFGVGSPVLVNFQAFLDAIAALLTNPAGSIQAAFNSVFGEGSPVRNAIQEAIDSITAMWDNTFGDKGGLRKTLDVLSSVVQGIFGAMRSAVMGILKTLLSPLITLLKAVALVAKGVGNDKLANDAATLAVQIEAMKADGGSVQAGKNYIVGEKGPELFRPGSSGSIMPNNRLQSAMAGGGGITISGPITINGVTDVEGMYDALNREARRRNR